MKRKKKNREFPRQNKRKEKRPPGRHHVHRIRQSILGFYQNTFTHQLMRCNLTSIECLLRPFAQPVLTPYLNSSSVLSHITRWKCGIPKLTKFELIWENDIQITHSQDYLSPGIARQLGNLPVSKIQVVSNSKRKKKTELIIP